MYRALILAAGVVFSSAAVAQAQSNQGSMKTNGRSLVFKHVVALKATADGEPRYLVLATGQPLSSAAMKSVQSKNASESVDNEVGQPYLKLSLRESGEVEYLMGSGGNSTFLTGSNIDGKATIADGKVAGEVSLVQTGDFAKEVRLSFNVPVTDANQPTAPVALAPPVKPSVSGKFLGDGKDGKLKFISVREGEPFSDKESITIVLTEKDHSKSAKPDFDASFKKFGSALILRVHHDGSIFGCEVAHSAHSKSPFSSVGRIHFSEFDLSGGNLKGHLSSGGADEFFGQTWEVDLDVAAPLPEKLRQPKKEAKVAAAEKKPGKKDMSDDAPAKPAGPKIPVQSLTLPATAKNVQYKKTVEHITFDSDANVATLAKDFGKSLTDQGWKDGPGSLMGKTNAILKRTKEGASLTIMVQPAGGGSQVKIFTEGLDWSNAAATAPKPASSVEKEVKKELDAAKDEINKALKDLPGGIPKDLLKGLD